MGINLSWIAVEGVGRDDLLHRLGFEVAGDTSDEIRAAYCCVALPNGWVVVTSRKAFFVTDKSLAGASAGGLALGGEIVETVMYSRLRAFRGGAQIWSVRHDPDKDGDDVFVDGEPPPQLQELQSRFQAEQAAHQEEPIDDLFDLAPALSQSLCGYRPVSSPRRDWVIVERKGPPKPDARRSLRSEMMDRLLPSLLSRGWTLAVNPPNLAEDSHIVRSVDGDQQSIWFEYEDGREAWIQPHFIAAIPNAKEADKRVQGHVRRPRVTPPLWKRLWGKPPPPESRVVGAIEGALQEIDVVDTFLRTFEPHPWIHIDYRYRGPPPEGDDSGPSLSRGA